MQNTKNIHALDLIFNDIQEQFSWATLMGTAQTV